MQISRMMSNCRDYGFGFRYSPRTYHAGYTCHVWLNHGFGTFSITWWWRKADPAFTANYE